MHYYIPHSPHKSLNKMRKYFERAYPSITCLLQSDNKAIVSFKLSPYFQGNNLHCTSKHMRHRITPNTSSANSDDKLRIIDLQYYIPFGGPYSEQQTADLLRCQHRGRCRQPLPRIFPNKTKESLYSISFEEAYYIIYPKSSHYHKRDGFRNSPSREGQATQICNFGTNFFFCF